MSRRMRSRSLLNIIPEEEEPSETVGPVVAQEPSDEKPEQKELPTESHDITSDQEKEDEGPPDIEGSDLEADLREVALPKAEREGRKSPDVQGEILPILAPTEVAEAEPDAEADLQDLAQLDVGDEDRHGPDIKEAVFQKAESIYMAEAGPDLANYLQELTLPKTEGEGRGS